MKLKLVILKNNKKYNNNNNNNNDFKSVALPKYVSALHLFIYKRSIRKNDAHEILVGDLCGGNSLGDPGLKREIEL